MVTSLGLLASHVSADCGASGKLSPIEINKVDRTRYYDEAEPKLLPDDITAGITVNSDVAEGDPPEFTFLSAVTVKFSIWNFPIGTVTGVSFTSIRIVASKTTNFQHKINTGYNRNSDKNQVEVQLHGVNLDQPDENAPNHKVVVSILYAVSDNPTQSTYEPTASGSADNYLTEIISRTRAKLKAVVLPVLFPKDTKTFYTYSGSLSYIDAVCKQNVFWIVYDYSNSDVGTIHVSTDFHTKFMDLYGQEGSNSDRKMGDGAEICPITMHSFGQQCSAVWDTAPTDSAFLCAVGESSKSDAEFCAAKESEKDDDTNDDDTNDEKDDGENDETADDCAKRFDCDYNSGKMASTSWFLAGILAFLAYW